MIEAKIDELIAALNANTAALGGAKAEAPAKPKKAKPEAAPEPAPAPAPAPIPAAPTVTAKECTDILMEVANKVERAAAIEILKKFGVAKISELKPEHHAEAYALAKAKLEAKEEIVEDDLV